MRVRRTNGARYVLLNPLGSMGRGVKSQARLAKTTLHMQEIFLLTAPLDGPDLDIVHIRFPNAEGKPLSGCEAGTIIYVFTPGEVTVCPYLIFAARTPESGIVLPELGRKLWGANRDSSTGAAPTTASSTSSSASP